MIVGDNHDIIIGGDDDDGIVSTVYNGINHCFVISFVFVVTPRIKLHVYKRVGGMLNNYNIL